MKKWTAIFEGFGTLQEWSVNFQECALWVREWALWSRDWIDGVGEHSPWVRNHLLLEKLHSDLGLPGHSSHGAQSELPAGIGIICPVRDQETANSSERMLFLSSIEWKESGAPARARR
jgi:hypothetical protein